jgi:protoporphyrinogen/coproporphyrinogen III oxidase
MADHDIIVIGGGISGMSFAAMAAAAGREVRVLEGLGRLGGCLHSERVEPGYWFEMGAHTAYNSYGGLLELIELCGMAGEIQPRRKAPFRLLRDGQLISFPKALSFWELALNAWRMPFASKEGRSVAEYYSSLTGENNYRKVLGPALSAVPSQNADGFPATMLFKKKPRRKDVVRSFTMERGLQSIVDAAGELDGIQVSLGVEVAGVERTDDGFAVVTGTGERHEARVVVLATPPDVAARLVAEPFPELATSLGRIAMAHVETRGVVVPASCLSFDPVAGIIAAEDLFLSAVSRDTVPDPDRRAFAFHFRPGHPDDERTERICEVLAVSREDLEAVVDKHMTLPSPAMGHEEIVAEIDQCADGTGVFVTGNYFDGLAIEDCVVRSKAELERLQGG